MRKKRVKIDLLIKFELQHYGLIVDYKGHIFKPPFKDIKGRLFGLKEIKPFSHNNEYLAIQLNNKIISYSKLFKTAIEVNYKKRFEIAEHKVPEDIAHRIVK